MKPTIAIAALIALAALTGCDSYPRDVEGTRDRVVESRQIRVGYGAMSAEQTRLAARFMSGVASATGAKPLPPTLGSYEALMAALEKGDLDLVVAEVAADSPWKTEVAVVEPLTKRRFGERELGLSVIARNGENRWLMVLERAAREMDQRE
jgi:ABC-type amino acid transport substrate-binding protein